MVIDRMALADLGNPTLIAEAVLKQLGQIIPPIPIREIAFGAGITDIKLIETSSFEGALITPDHKSTGVILIRATSSHERQRFSLGHEVGHYLNQWHVPPEGGFKCTLQDLRTQLAAGIAARPKMEAEANEFSVEILMPRKLFCADLQSMQEPGLEHICQLSARYEMSKIATARRFLELHGDPMAFIVSKDGVAEQIYNENGFPSVAVKRGQDISRRTKTRTFSGGRDECSDTEAGEWALWLSQAPRSGAELFEQVLVQGNGYRLTLLSLNEADAEDDEEEDARERSEWNPRFR
jgi:Zn-dependent peptidase ImmA (M78 family)